MALWPFHGDSHDRGGTDELHGVMPIGTGVWWWGNVNQIPTGWKLCDGTQGIVNGSTPPDMRDKMPIGAGTTYALAAAGGAASVAVIHSGGAVTGDHTQVHNHSSGGGLGATAGGVTMWDFAQASGAQSNNPATHGFTQPSNHSVPTLPPYVAWYFIVRVR